MLDKEAILILSLRRSISSRHVSSFINLLHTIIYRSSSVLCLQKNMKGGLCTGKHRAIEVRFSFQKIKLRLKDAYDSTRL
jgi:hypothetical protein